MTSHDESPTQERPQGRLVVGIGLILFGLLFLAYQLHLLPDRFPYGLVPVDEPWRLWPMILVVMGVAKLVSGGWLRGKGHFLLAMGLVFQTVMLEREHLLGMWWPLLLVWWGLITLLRALHARTPSQASPQVQAPAEPESHD